MNSIPLVDAIPWIRDDKDSAKGEGRTWLVNDSTETDGKFLMYSLAVAQASNGSSSSSSSFRRATNTTTDKNSNNNAKIIWLSCGPSTQQDVAQSLKKAGCDAATTYLRRNNNNTLRMNPSSSSNNNLNNPPSSSSLLSILPVSLELSNLLMSQSKGEEKINNIDDILWNDESDCYYLKTLYQTVKAQVMEQNESNSRRVLVFIDDVSYLSVLFGNSTTFLFLQKMRSLISSQTTNGMLTIRCMNETDQQLVLDTSTNDDHGQQNNSDVRGGKNLEWVGAGGNVSRRLSYHNNSNNRNNQFSRFICEIANVIMDVMPLQSGFSREVHGRILFTQKTTKKEDLAMPHFVQQKQQQQPTKKLPRDDSFLLNYCCTESGVKVMRLRS